LALKPGKHKIVSLTRKIFEELYGRKRAKLYYLTPLPNFNYEGLCFEILRDLEIALIKDFKTTKKYGGWNKVDK